DRLDGQPVPSLAPVTHPLFAPSHSPSPSASPVPAPRQRIVVLPEPRRLAAVGGAAVVLVVLGLSCARAVRRLRHRGAGARGAWSEVMDLLVLARRPVPRDWPATRIAADLAGSVPRAEPVLRIAEYADRAAFGPAPADTPDPWPELRRVRRAVRR